MRHVVMLCLLLGAGACDGPRPPVTSPERMERTLADPVRQPVPSPERPRYVGLVTPRATIDVKSTVPGQLVELVVGLGDRVEANDVVAILENGDLRHAVRLAEASARSARARLSEARSTHELSRDKARQTEALREHVSADERTERQHDLRRAGAAASSARSDLGGQHAQIDRLRAQVEALVLRAPFAAEVAAIYHDPGASLPPDEPVVRLVSTEQVVRFAVDAEDLGEFAIGSSVELVSDVDRTTVVASVVALAPEVDSAGMVLVEASIASAASVPRLRTGTHGHVRSLMTQ